MKFVLGFLSILVSLSCFSQSEIKVLYIDASGNPDRLNEIISKAKEIINEEDENTLLYIANGSIPSHTTSGSEFDKTLNEIINGGIFSPPSLMEDVNQINEYLLDKGWVSNLADENQKPVISFYFMVEESNYESTNFFKEFINYLLLSNNLISSGTLLDSCSVTIILEQSNGKGITVNKNKSFTYEDL
jgi:hypothetical protein